MRISRTDYRTSLSLCAEAVGHRECAPLVGFQGDFLRQHDVARGQIAVWQKTPSADRLAGTVELRDVHLTGAVDAVNASAVATDHLEIPAFLITTKLCFGQPFLEKSQTTSFNFAATPTEARRVADALKRAMRGSIKSSPQSTQHREKHQRARRRGDEQHFINRRPGADRTMSLPRWDQSCGLPAVRRALSGRQP